MCKILVLTLCVSSTRQQWRRGWGSGKSTCRTGAGRTCRPSPTPPCSGCPASRVTPGSVATWPSQRPADWKHRPASTPWMAAYVNGQVVSRFFMNWNQRGKFYSRVVSCRRGCKCRNIQNNTFSAYSYQHILWLKMARIALKSRLW